VFDTAGVGAPTGAHWQFMARQVSVHLVLWPVLLLTSTSDCFGQSGGTIRGTVRLEPSKQPTHNARMILSPLGRSTDSGEDGKFEFRDVPPGSYHVIARSPGLADDRQPVRIAAGATETVDLSLRVAPIRESVTVTATGREETTLDVMQSVTSLQQTELPQRSATSLGEVLEGLPGIAKRSFGPGTSRPVVRGFDGDRVLILEDGIRTGTLSSQSGDHGEPVDTNSLERLEVVRGPGTLLYGSNAVGGVVNAVSRHDVHRHPFPGVRGFLTGLGGSNNGLGGGSGGFELGLGQWQFWASGGGQRTSDFQTPIGTIENSQSRMEQARGGLGRYGDKGFLTFNYAFTDSRYGIPFDPHEEDPEVAELLLRRHAYRASGGLKNVGFLEGIQARFNYSDYDHQEIVDGKPGTLFFNKQTAYRTAFDQKKRGRLGGSFGFWGMHRDYKTVGKETLAPPTTQNAFAAFALESLDLETTRIQFGGRVEHNRYNPTGLRERSFTGLSGAVGLSQRLWRDGAFVVNYSHSFRAPALEELYNNGPHPGNLAFEVGNPDLVAERNNGLDTSLRHQSSRLHGELNFFYYRVSDFVYLAPTGHIEDGLIEAEYLQRNSRFVGGEAKLDLGLHRNFWINVGADTVNAKLRASKTFLPRIPPVRGRVGFDARYKGLSLRPELAMAYSQNKLAPTEERTAGYAVVNLLGSYTIARAHHLHVFSASLFNAGDRLYRNHLSFIKEFSPEIGRGVRFTYTLQFF
jgi:iron complex outermembrane receptor protein